MRDLHPELKNLARLQAQQQQVYEATGVGGVARRPSLLKHDSVRGSNLLGRGSATIVSRSSDQAGAARARPFNQHYSRAGRGFGVAADRDYFQGLVVGYVVDCFLLVDMGLQGITIIYDVRWGIVDTVDELRRRYVRSWRFVVDAAACLPWEVVALTLGRGPNSLLFSQLRMSRVVRIYRVRETLQRWGLNIRMNSNAVGIVNCVFFIVFASHFVACVWFWLAYTSSSTKRDVVQQSVESLLASEPNTWLDLVLDWQDMKTSLLYVKSLYWTMSTMTTVGYGAAKGRDVPNFEGSSLGRVGYGDLTPVSTKEHWYAIFVMLFGSILFGYIFGLMASLVASMDVTMAAFRMKVDSVQRFLHYRNVRGSSASACTATTTTRDMIISVPLFKNAEPAFVRAIVLRLLPTVFPENEKVVLKGEVGREMFFIQRGHCEVVNDETGEMLVELQDGQYFGEVSILCEARRTATVLNGKKRDDAAKPETDEERRQRAEKRKLEQKLEEVSANTAKSSEAREEERTRIVGQTMVQAFKARRASTLAPVEEQKADVQASVMYAAPRRAGLERMSSKRRLSAAGIIFIVILDFPSFVVGVFGTVTSSLVVCGCLPATGAQGCGYTAAKVLGIITSVLQLGAMIAHISLWVIFSVSGTEAIGWIIWIVIKIASLGCTVALTQKLFKAHAAALRDESSRQPSVIIGSVVEMTPAHEKA
ncbi:cyclic nucleotide-gated ion channel [Aureococcus anophagefferens]|nr:cyclic nucleotide-gated ion channel [Aureococcus anophagefferens]